MLMRLLLSDQFRGAVMCSIIQSTCRFACNFCCPSVLQSLVFIQLSLSAIMIVKAIQKKAFISCWIVVSSLLGAPLPQVHQLLGPGLNFWKINSNIEWSVPKLYWWSKRRKFSGDFQPVHDLCVAVILDCSKHSYYSTRLMDGND